MANRHVGFFEESTYGTGGVPTHFLEVRAEDIHLERNSETIETIDSFSPVDIQELTRVVRGSFRHAANFDGEDVLFDHLFGAATEADDAPAAGWYTDSFPGSAGIPATDRIGKSLTIEVNRGAGNWRYEGCKLVAHEFSMGAQQIGEDVWEVLGQGEDTGQAAATPTFPTRGLLLPANGVVTFDGGSALKVQSGSVRIENPLDEPYTYGGEEWSVEPDRQGILSVALSLDILMTDLASFYTSFDGSSDVDVVFTITGASNNSRVYNINKLRLTQATPPMTGRERLVATVEGSGVFNTAATENVEVVTVNQTEYIP